MLMEEASAWKLMEEASIGNLQSYVKGDAAPSTEMLELVFVIKQKNLDRLEEILNQVSDPKSPMYGHYLTKTQIDDLTRNTEGQVAVTKYLTEQSVSITHVTSDSVRMTVTGPVSVWESALNTQFFHFTDPTGVLPAVTRTLSYSLPDTLSDFISTVSNTVQFPVNMHSGPSIRSVHTESIDLVHPMLPGDAPKHIFHTQG